MLEIFFKIVKINFDIVCKEVWVNIFEVEVNLVFSFFYELIKRIFGDLVILCRLDVFCVIRKLILGLFKSNLNFVGIMFVDWVVK